MGSESTNGVKALHPAQWIDAVCGISVDAGERILDVYNSDFAVEHKEDKSPLTAADLASNDVIAAGLSALTPAIPLLSEESRAIPFAERQSWTTYWLIDPLDGTKEFINRNGEFTVNIALIHEGVPVLGVVYVPVTDRIYVGCEGVGASRGSGRGVREPISVRELVSPPVIVGSRSHRGESLNAFLEKLGDYDLVSMGSSLKFCIVAEGGADAYPRLGPTSEWDTAAAQCVVEQAGGEVTDLSGKRLMYNTKDSLLNPFFMVSAQNAAHWVSLCDS